MLPHEKYTVSVCKHGGNARGNQSTPEMQSNGPGDNRAQTALPTIGPLLLQQTAQKRAENSKKVTQFLRSKMRHFLTCNRIYNYHGTVVAP